jgi:hypothetical protein
MIICDICEKSFSNKGIGTHKWRSHGDGKNFKPLLGKCGWNKGLTKETDARLAKSGKTYHQGIKNGRIITWNEGKTKSTDDRLKKMSEEVSETVQKKVINGDWHLSFSKTRTHEYKGVRLRGKWEVAYAQYLDERCIEWTQPTKPFPYEFEGKTLHYFPDFYLIKDETYVEIKGYETEKDRAKWNHFPQKLIVLKGKDLVELGLPIEYKKL